MLSSGYLVVWDADLICVIKDGPIVEQGMHWKLLKLSDVYAELVRQ